MEGVLGPAAVGHRVGQRADQVEELGERAGVGVQEQQRRGVGSAERTWTKWMVWPSISVTKLGTAFIRASCARQSNCCQRSTMSRR